jgi:hypothetical protein
MADNIWCCGCARSKKAGSGERLIGLAVLAFGRYASALGRPSLKDSNADKVAAIRGALAAKKGIRRIARERQTAVNTVPRIRAELAA